MPDRPREASASHPSDEFVRQLTVHQNTVYGYIFSLLLDHDLADDVLQETNVVLCRKCHEYTPGTDFLAWACTTAHYQVKARRRDMARDRLVFDDDLLNDLATEAIEFAGQSDARISALRECIEELPKTKREDLQDRYISGETVKEIAQRRGRSANGLAVTFFRARQALLDCVEGKLAGRLGS